MDSSTKSSSYFFKTFRDPDREQRLILPLTWNSKQGSMLPSVAYLRTGHGIPWAVTLAHDERTGRYSFEEGWRSFVGYNKLEYKDRLEFEYDGHSTFDFKLLNRNNEQEHICVPNLGQAEGLQVQPEEQPESEEERRPEPAYPSSADTGEDFNVSDKSEVEEVTRKRAGKKRALRITEADEEAVIQKASIPYPDNPYFVTKLRTNRKEMYVPIELIRDFQLAFPKEIAIHDESGREFKASVQTWKDGRVWLSRGWRLYCKENKVHQDDWCIVEVVQPERPAATMFLKARMVRAAASQQIS